MKFVNICKCICLFINYELPMALLVGCLCVTFCSRPTYGLRAYMAVFCFIINVLTTIIAYNVTCVCIIILLINIDSWPDKTIQLCHFVSWRMWCRLSRIGQLWPDTFTRWVTSLLSALFQLSILIPRVAVHCLYILSHRIFCLCLLGRLDWTVQVSNELPLR